MKESSVNALTEFSLEQTHGARKVTKISKIRSVLACGNTVIRSTVKFRAGEDVVN
jgi:hypothetical protein